jgi:hypothetical protein
LSEFTLVIARSCYLEGRTRVQIAEEFGLSRFKVARMLEEALESGMVEIKIHDPASIDIELSTAPQRQYSLQHAYAVTADSNNSADRVETVAKATAELMHSILRDGDVIGVVAVAPWPGLPNATLSNSRFGRNTRYQRRRPRTADQRHHGWYVLAPLRPVGHGRCANGGQPRRRS